MGQGFEPWIGFPIHAFQACAIDHSAIPPFLARPLSVVARQQKDKLNSELAQGSGSHLTHLLMARTLRRLFLTVITMFMDDDTTAPAADDAVATDETVTSDEETAPEGTDEASTEEAAS